MNFRSITARTAVAGAVTALAAAGLVGVTSVSAQAADATGSYDCTALGNPVGTFPLTVSVPLLPPSAPAGMTITPLLGVTAELTVPSALLQLTQTDGGTVDDFAMTLGSTAIGAPLTVSSITDNGDGTSTVTADGVNETFTTPKAGTYDVKLPASFTFQSTSNGTPGAQVSCSTADPATLASVTLSKQASEIAAKVKRTTKGYNLVATVTNEYSTPTGKVVVKLGTKKIDTKTLKNGKAVFALPKSAKGKTAKLIYKGDGYTAGKSTSVKIK